MMHTFQHGVVVYILKAFVDDIPGPKCKSIDILAREMFTNHRSSELAYQFVQGCNSFEINEMLRMARVLACLSDTCAVV